MSHYISDDAPEEDYMVADIGDMGNEAYHNGEPCIAPFPPGSIHAVLWTDGWTNAEIEAQSVRARHRPGTTES